MNIKTPDYDNTLGLTTWTGEYGCIKIPKCWLQYNTSLWQLNKINILSIALTASGNQWNETKLWLSNIFKSIFREIQCQKLINNLIVSPKNKVLVQTLTLPQHFQPLSHTSHIEKMSTFSSVYWFLIIILRKLLPFILLPF